MTFQEWMIIVNALEEHKKACMSQAEQELVMVKQYEKVISDNDINHNPDISKSMTPWQKENMEKVYDEAVNLREEYVTKYGATKKKVAEINVVLSKIKHMDLKID